MTCIRTPVVHLETVLVRYPFQDRPYGRTNGVSILSWDKGRHKNLQLSNSCLTGLYLKTYELVCYLNHPNNWSSQINSQVRVTQWSVYLMQTSLHRRQKHLNSVWASLRFLKKYGHRVLTSASRRMLENPVNRKGISLFPVDYRGLGGGS